jgi:hypothetical protein
VGVLWKLSGGNREMKWGYYGNLVGVAKKLSGGITVRNFQWRYYSREHLVGGIIISTQYIYLRTILNKHHLQHLP